MPRFTIRRWLAVVAAFAVLDRGAAGLLPLTLFLMWASVFWIPSIPPVAWFRGLIKPGWPYLAAAAALVFALALHTNPSPFSGSYAISRPIGVGLNLANFMGPLHAANRRRRGLPLAPGHWLWAWAGLVWLFQVEAPFISRGRPSHLSFEYDLVLMIAGARLLLAAAILALSFGRRPAGRDRAHLAGWLVIECDVAIWGWQAARRLGWVG